MKALNEFLNEKAITKVPTSEDDVLDYLKSNLSNITKDNWESEINKLKSTWTDDDLECAIDSGSCSTWNTDIYQVLSKKKIKCHMYEGDPINDSLPTHYITICNNKIVDFVVEQFFGYGLGNKLNEENAVFSEKEYLDIKKSYNWKKIK